MSLFVVVTDGPDADAGSIAEFEAWGQGTTSFFGRGSNGSSDGIMSLRTSFPPNGGPVTEGAL